MAKRGCNVVANGNRDRAACDAVAKEAESGGIAALVAIGGVGSAAAAGRHGGSGDALRFARVRRRRLHERPDNRL